MQPADSFGFQYNNGNYMLLDEVIEAITQKPYQEYFAQKNSSPQLKCFIRALFSKPNAINLRLMAT